MNEREVKNLAIWVQSAVKIQTLIKKMNTLERSGDILTATFLALPLFELMLFIRVAVAYPDDDMSRLKLSHLISVAVYSGKEAGLKQELERARKFRNSIMHGKGFILKSRVHLRDEYSNVKTVIIKLAKSVDREIDELKENFI